VRVKAHAGPSRRVSGAFAGKGLVSQRSRGQGSRCAAWPASPECGHLIWPRLRPLSA
jgi:hypothetical protein